MRNKIAVFALVALATLGTGCASAPPPLKMYLISQNGGTPPAPQLDDSTPNVVLSKLAVAGFLDKSGIIYQTTENEVSVAARNLWAEPLPDQIERALYDELTRRAQGVTIFKTVDAAPVRSVRLSVSFSGFHGRYDGQAIVSGVWSLADAQNQLLLRQPFNYESALQSDGYSELVAALAAGLDALAGDIAATLGRFSESQSADDV